MAMKGLDTLATPMRPRVLAKYLGVFGLSLAVMMAVAGGGAFGLADYRFAANCVIVALLLAAAGLPLARLRAAERIRQGEAMAVTALGFMLGGLAMAWPFAAAGMAPLDALFESVSAITTTGLSAAGSVADMPRAFVLARSWAQWCGGLGIVVLAFVLVLGPGIAARRLSPGETAAEDLVEGTWIRGRRLLVLYAGMTAGGGVLLWLFGASPFDAAVHALSSLSTGGFSSHDDSVAGIGGGALPVLVALLCLGGGVSFSLQYRSWRSGPMTLLRDGEVRLLAATILAVWGLILFSEWLAGTPIGGGLAANAAFMTVSAQTTSGFQTVDPAGLAPATKLSLILSMIIGGDIGSTAGGIKIVRLLVILRLLQLLFARTVTPRHAVLNTGLKLDSPEIAAAVSVVTLYAAAILLSWFCFLLAGLDPLDSLFDVVSAIGTVGLSTGVAGPDLAAPLKLVLCLDMLMGRLEILAVLVLAYPRSWLGPREGTS